MDHALYHGLGDALRQKNKAADAHISQTIKEKACFLLAEHLVKRVEAKDKDKPESNQEHG